MWTLENLFECRDGMEQRDEIYLPKGPRYPQNYSFFLSITLATFEDGTKEYGLLACSAASCMPESQF